MGRSPTTTHTTPTVALASAGPCYWSHLNLLSAANIHTTRTRKTESSRLAREQSVSFVWEEKKKPSSKLKYFFPQNFV